MRRTFHKTLTIFALAACATATVDAQTYTQSTNYSKAWGNSTLGAYIYGTGYLRTEFSRSRNSSNVYFNYLRGYVQGYSRADLRFLGSRYTAGYVLATMDGRVSYRQNGAYGTPYARSCYHSGRIYMKVGGTVIWNQSFTTRLRNGLDWNLRIGTPSITVPFGGGIVGIRGRAYGRLRGSIDLTVDGCNGRVYGNGYAAASGRGYMSMWVVSAFVGASADFTFYVNDQRLALERLNVRTAYGSDNHYGNLRLYSGSMRGRLEIDAILPPFIPVSITRANWSKSSTTKTLL